MRALAPGKLVLTGAYAVLDGAPAIVAAVDRYAVADASRVSTSPAPEVRAAFGEASAPETDVRALHDTEGRKLGLGSSAAAVVASLAAKALARGADLTNDRVRAGLFLAARRAHARVQNGGSGVDVAASVYGGVLRYVVGEFSPTIRRVAWPADVAFAAYFGGVSARTTDLRARVAALRSERPQNVTPLAKSMADTARLAADALEAGNASGFVAAARIYGALLAELGRMADAPIVPPAFAELASVAEREGAGFLPSGAGGGDVAVWLGTLGPSAAFADRARALGLTRLPLSIDRVGVRGELLPN
jgi:phosphomevalonate kinase